MKMSLFGDGNARFLRLTAEANEAFEDDHLDIAMRLYEDALTEASRLFDGASAGSSPLIAPMAYVIACNNIAEVKIRAESRAAADRLRVAALTKLVDTAESPMHPLALRANCVRHMRCAIAFVAKDLRGQPAPDLERLLKRCRAISNKLARASTIVLNEDRHIAPAPNQLN